ncbi:MAG: acetyl-CoA carboxylase biotin carboxyl carrier protein [Gammaproteobacteria bacterium]|nr:acetyl-CoA carboxylase biotin carboxyl carrier protein [Gammaproteobacteria bacterium]MCP5198863.1 acetyl-CoA carboxylase biotin carboxyl carrier protein [Gammaproteobacteria bacterium]
MEPSDIRRLLDAFEQSDWNEIRLSVDGVEVFISASDEAAPPATSPRAAVAPPATPAAPATTTSASAPAAATASSTPAEIPAGEAVRSPSPGIFWRSPSPGAPPFVEVGQHVEAGTVVCIVEVMKLMNRVVAGVAGTVVAIVVENSQQVARDQALVVIRPDAG